MTRPQSSLFLFLRLVNVSTVPLPTAWTSWGRDITLARLKRVISQAQDSFPCHVKSFINFYLLWIRMSVSRASACQIQCMGLGTSSKEPQQKPKSVQAWARASIWHRLRAGPRRMLFPCLLKELSKSDSIISASTVKSWQDCMKHRNKSLTQYQR